MSEPGSRLARFAIRDRAASGVRRRSTPDKGDFAQRGSAKAFGAFGDRSAAKANVKVARSFVVCERPDEQPMKAPFAKFLPRTVEELGSES